MKFHEGDLVLIEWEDHYNHGEPGWKSAGDFNASPMYIETVGFVIKDTTGRVALSPTRHEDVENNIEYCGGVSVRIKKDIRSVQVLRKA